HRSHVAQPQEAENRHAAMIFFGGVVLLATLALLGALPSLLFGFEQVFDGLLHAAVDFLLLVFRERLAVAADQPAHQAPGHRRHFISARFFLFGVAFVIYLTLGFDLAESIFLAQLFELFLMSDDGFHQRFKVGERARAFGLRITKRREVNVVVRHAINRNQRFGRAATDAPRERLHHAVNGAVVIEEDFFHAVAGVVFLFDEEEAFGVEEEACGGALFDQLDAVGVATINRDLRGRLRRDLVTR